MCIKKNSRVKTTSFTENKGKKVKPGPFWQKKRNNTQTMDKENCQMQDEAEDCQHAKCMFIISRFFSCQSIIRICSSSVEALFKLQDDQRQKINTRMNSKLCHIFLSQTNLYHLSLTLDLGGMLGFWASDGFFRRAGFVGFGDMEEDVSPFPSETSLRGTPAKS